MYYALITPLDLRMSGKPSLIIELWDESRALSTQTPFMNMTAYLGD